MLPDYYTILGVPSAATPEEIKQAFRSLALQYHPDVLPGKASASSTAHFRTIYEAYRVLSAAESRAHYDYQWTQQQSKPAHPQTLVRHSWGTYSPAQQQSGLPVPAFIPSLELSCPLSHTLVPIYPNEQLIYALSEIIPIADGQLLNALPLNLCLVIDRSSSMRGEKLRVVKMALRSLIERLQRGDILSVVAFDNRAEVIVRAETRQIPDVMISTIERLSERGGTEIGKGLEAALEEVKRFSKQPMVSHIILLTDGKTYGDEARCLELAFKARQSGISITALGIGTAWNDQLLDQIADLSDGMSDYLATANDIAAALDRRVKILRSTLATNVKLSLALEGGVRLRRVTRVAPDLTELLDAGPAGQQWMLAREAELEVGIISADNFSCALALLWEIMLPANATGRYYLGQITMQYDIPYAKLVGQRQRESLIVEFVEAQSLTSTGVSPHVKQVIEYVTAYRIQQKAQEALQQGNHSTASQLLQTASERLRDADQDDLAKQAQEQSEQLSQQHVPARASMLKLKYSTKNLVAHRRLASE